jgi:upstream activation factor subunit UAF30
LGEKYGCDLQDRKDEIDRIVMAVVSESTSSASKASQSTTKASTSSSLSLKAVPPSKTVNGKNVKEESDDEGSVEEEDAKLDSASDNEQIDDEDFARQLQEEESRGARRTRKAVQSNRKRKSTTKDSKDKGEKKVRKTNKYNEPCTLSPELAAIVGQDQLPRHEVVKKMWAIVKERNLYDPKNKQFMICDDQLLTVFGRRKVRTFGMMKYLKEHITSPSATRE